MVASIIRPVGIASIAFLLLGCGSNSPTELTIRGKIYFQDRPLNGGMIVLIPEKERGNAGELLVTKVQSDGGYQLESTQNDPILPGLYRITVATSARNSAGSQRLFQEVPNRYRDPNLSGLMVEIKSGSNHVDLFLDNY